MPAEYGFLFDKQKCIECHSCEAACKSWRRVELGVRWRRVDTVWVGDYPDVSCFAVSVSCLHCVDPECVKACPEAAIQKLPTNGAVIVDPEKCIACRTCLEACPFEVPQFGSDEKMQKCDLCRHEIDFEKETPPCVRACPTGALLFEEMEKTHKAEMERAIKEMRAIASN